MKPHITCADSSTVRSTSFRLAHPRDFFDFLHRARRRSSSAANARRIGTSRERGSFAFSLKRRCARRSRSMRASPHFTAPREGRSNAGKRVANRFARDDAYASSESTRRTPFAFFSSSSKSSDATRVSSLSHSDTTTRSPSRFSSDSDASAFPTNCATSTAFLTCFAGTVPGPLTSYHAAPVSHPALYPPSALSSLTPLSRAMRNNGLYSWHPCTNDAPRSTFVAGSVMVFVGVVVFFPVLSEKPEEESMGSIGSSTATTRSGRVSVKTLPPTRSRASRTITSTPALRSTRAALRPAGPAPTTTTRGTRPVVHAVFGRSRVTVLINGSANGGTAARVVFFSFVSAF